MSLPQTVRRLSWLALAAGAAAACSGKPANQTAAQPAGRAAVAIMSACSLLTPDEANAVLRLPEIAARRSRDSVAEAARGESRCVFGPPPHKGIGEVVTVFVANGLPEQDQASLNQVASDMTGEQAQTVTGLGVPAAMATGLPTIVAQKGSYRVLVSAPTMDGTKTLAAKAIDRLP